MDVGTNDMRPIFCQNFVRKTHTFIEIFHKKFPSFSFMDKPSENQKFLEILYYTVWGQKKPPKVNECSSVGNYRTAMIFFLQSSQHSYVFFDGNFFCREFVCLPFFALFRLSRVQKGPKNTPRSTKLRF